MRSPADKAVYRVAIVTAGVVFALGGAASAQSAAPAASVSPADPDRAALASIVMRSVAEVQLCELAVEKTQNVDVRSFCRGAVAAHERIALSGLQLAQTLGARDMKLQPLPATSASLSELAQYSGHEFDRAFLLVQIEDHEQDQDAIRYAAEVATDRAVKRYEDGVLPKVEHQLQLAEGALHTISADQP